jgi:hypothetical protein
MQPGFVADNRDVPRQSAFGERQDRRCVSLDTRMSAVKYLDE